MQHSCSFQFTGTILWSAQLTLFQEVAWSCVCQMASSWDIYMTTSPSCHLANDHGCMGNNYNVERDIEQWIHLFDYMKVMLYCNNYYVTLYLWIQQDILWKKYNRPSPSRILWMGGHWGHFPSFLCFFESWSMTGVAKSLLVLRETMFCTLVVCIVTTEIIITVMFSPLGHNYQHELRTTTQNSATEEFTQNTSLKLSRQDTIR